MFLIKWILLIRGGSKVCTQFGYLCDTVYVSRSGVKVFFHSIEQVCGWAWGVSPCVLMAF